MLVILGPFQLQSAFQYPGLLFLVRISWVLLTIMTCNIWYNFTICQSGNVFAFSLPSTMQLTTNSSFKASYKGELAARGKLQLIIERILLMTKGTEGTNFV